MLITNTDKLRMFALKESGVSFKDIARQIGGLSAQDVSDAVADVLVARVKSKQRVKVVYRKRITTSQGHLQKLVSHMKELV